MLSLRLTLDHLRQLMRGLVLDLLLALRLWADQIGILLAVDLSWRNCRFSVGALIRPRILVDHHDICFHLVKRLQTVRVHFRVLRMLQRMLLFNTFGFFSLPNRTLFT